MFRTPDLGKSTLRTKVTTRHDSGAPTPETEVVTNDKYLPPTC
jgi:hypothetical protein